MNENKQSIFGIENTDVSTNITSAPFLISIPEEQDLPANAPQSISTSSPAQPPTIESEAPIAPPPPPLLEADTPLTPPYLLQKEGGENAAPAPSAPQVSGSKNVLSANKISADPMMKFITQETEVSSISAYRPQEQKLPKSLTAKETVQQAISSSLEQKEKAIESASMQLESLKNKNQSKQTFIALKPAFENIEKVLKFQAENSIKRDYDEQHYTVAQTQSLFNLTANQISGMPYWRGK